MRTAIAIALVATISHSTLGHSLGRRVLAQTNSAAQSDTYDEREWSLVKQEVADIDGDSSPEQILLLKSTRATGESGVGNPLNDVQLLIIKNGNIVFDYVRDVTKKGGRFFMDDLLLIGDLTSDSVPEILFRSGYQAASDYSLVNHIIRYDAGKRQFGDVGPADFVESGTHRLRWSRIGAHSIAVIAHRDYRAWEAQTRQEDRCHYCDGPFVYDAYHWDSAQDSFVLYRTFNATRNFGTGETAFSTDWAYIEEQLRPAP